MPSDATRLKIYYKALNCCIQLLYMYVYNKFTDRDTPRTNDDTKMMQITFFWCMCVFFSITAVLQNISKRPSHYLMYCKFSWLKCLAKHNGRMLYIGLSHNVRITYRRLMNASLKFIYLSTYSIWNLSIRSCTYRETFSYWTGFNWTN